MTPEEYNAEAVTIFQDAPPTFAYDGERNLVGLDDYYSAEQLRALAIVLDKMAELNERWSREKS